MTNDVPPTVRPAGFEFNNPTIIALLYIASMLTGITGIVGVVLAYVWRGEATTGWERSHYEFHIRSFWIGLLFGVIGGVLMIVGIGFLILLAVSVWFLVRSIKAMLAAQRHEPIADVGTWLW